MRAGREDKRYLERQAPSVCTQPTPCNVCGVFVVVAVAVAGRSLLSTQGLRQADEQWARATGEREAGSHSRSVRCARGVSFGDGKL
jgi:hypothetical protein